MTSIITGPAGERASLCATAAHTCRQARYHYVQPGLKHIAGHRQADIKYVQPGIKLYLLTGVRPYMLTDIYSDKRKTHRQIDRHNVHVDTYSAGLIFTSTDGSTDTNADMLIHIQVGRCLNGQTPDKLIGRGTSMSIHVSLFTRGMPIN